MAKLFIDRGKQIKKIAGYKIKINKRKYPDSIYNYCTLLLDDREINLGDPVGDLRKKETITTLKQLIQSKILNLKLGEDYQDVLDNQKGFEVFDWLDNQLDHMQFQSLF